MRRALLILLWTAMVSTAWAEPMPQAIAAHFCQLLVKTQEGRLMSLHAFIRQTATINDSLSVEQQFVDYVFQYGGWQSLRIFPHQQADGTIVWLAPDDIDLPATISEEHRKYISEVLPRMATEVEATNWATFDEYTNRLLKYQRIFSATTPVSQAEGSTIPILIGILYLIFLATSFNYHKVTRAFESKGMTVS